MMKQNLVKEWGKEKNRGDEIDGEESRATRKGC